MRPLTFSLRFALIGACAATLSACVNPPGGGSGAGPMQPPFAQQEACRSLVPASIGGPMPEGDTAVLRWLGTSNFELAYHGKVVVMDTYFDRPPRTRSVGFTASQVRRADIILVGHAHSDHISDIQPVAKATGAPVIGSAITTATAVKLGVPQAQTRSVQGGEVINVGDISITPTHVVHSTIQPELIPALSNLYKVDGLRPLSSEEEAEGKRISALGTFDPGVITQGTMGFTLTLSDNFRIVWFDSVGNPNDEERQLAAQLDGKVDVGIFPYTPHAIAETQLAYTMQHVRLFKPRLYVPDHHDHIWGVWLDNGLAPLFMQIRDELPGTAYVDPLYRSPLCMTVTGPDKGRFHMGQ